MKDDCTKKKWDTLVVWKLDRIARSTSHLLEVLALLQKHEKGFVSVTEAIDTQTPAGKMIATLIGAIAECKRG